MAGLTAPKELKQLPKFKTNLQDPLFRCNLSFQDKSIGKRLGGCRCIASTEKVNYSSAWNGVIVDGGR
jgi:hypothetical protein